MGGGAFQAVFRSQVLDEDTGGHARWSTLDRREVLAPANTALLLCDVWDSHWCRGARERVDVLAPRIEGLARGMRERGAQIIHAPSETMAAYADDPARLRMLNATGPEPPQGQERPDPPLPIDDSDGGSDTGEKPWFKAWTRQHAAIAIDSDRDAITDSGLELYRFLNNQGIQHLLIVGVHTNMCVLHRSFGIKQMVRWGVKTALVRDLTDTMYNPAMPPYVSHDEGTRLVVEFIEKFWCPTILSDELLD